MPYLCYDIAEQLYVKYDFLLESIAAGEDIDKIVLEQLVRALLEEARLSRRQIAIKLGINREIIRKLSLDPE